MIGPRARAPRPRARSRPPRATRSRRCSSQRLKWTLRARLRQRARLPGSSSTRPGVHPATCGRSRTSRIPVHHQGGPARQLSVRHVRGAAGAGRAHPCLVRHHRQADGGRLHRGATSTPGPRSGRALDPRRRRPAGHDGARRLRLRPVHRRARRALRRRAAGLHGDPGLGRHDRAAGAADPRLRARHHHGDAELHARDPRRVPRARASIRARRSLRIGIFGAEPWTNAMRAEIEQALRHATRSTSTASPR